MRSHLHEEGFCKEIASAKALRWKEFGLLKIRRSVRRPRDGRAWDEVRGCWAQHTELQAW